jgi:hypothetical protein
VSRQEEFDRSSGEITGYEGLADEQFWAEVRELLELLARHHGGEMAAQVGALADYMRAEADRRDPQLAASTARTAELAKAAWDRACDGGMSPLDAWDADICTPAETAELDQMGGAYARRLAQLARHGGGLP